MAKNKFDSQNELSQALKFYNIKTLEDAYPIELYNITSVNAQGYAIIDKNISSYDVSNGIKGKKISFCLIRKGYALCGNGGLVKTIDGVDVDFTPYILKSLETVRMGVNTEDR